MLYATHVLKNSSDEVRLVTVTGNWTTGDGFLFAYDSFNPAAPREGCLVGSDDYADNALNRQDGSRITRLSIPPGEERTLVVTSFYNTFSGEYTLDIFGEHATEISYAALPERGGFFYSTGTLHTNDALATSYGTGCDDVLSGDYFYDEILLHNQSVSAESEGLRVFVTVPDEPILVALLLNSGTCYKLEMLQDGLAFRDFMNADERLRVRIFSRLPSTRVGNWTVRVESF
ncbi:MAG: hypothetical protein GY822_28815 [Deltaproteobacteria bacterium]|nr:hypothetical protein [Deltaproteobacteria bacterium]